jgi:hypothetical protein
MKPSDLKKQAQEMIARNEMLTFEEVLEAIAATKEKFAPKIEAARKATRETRKL